MRLVDPYIKISSHAFGNKKQVCAENRHASLQLKEFFRKSCVCKVVLIIKVPLSYRGIVYLSTSSTLFDLQPTL